MFISDQSGARRNRNNLTSKVKLAVRFGSVTKQRVFFFSFLFFHNKSLILPLTNTEIVILFLFQSELMQKQ